MHFNNLLDFLAMGGYSRYVWPAYGIVLIALVFALVFPLRMRRRHIRDIQAQHADNT